MTRHAHGRLLPPLVAAAALCLLAACGSDPQLGRAESERALTVANDRIHALHLEAFVLAEWPTTYETACPEGGSLAMVTAGSIDGVPTDLQHQFTACGSEGLVLGGRLDYLEVDFCTASSATFRMVGDLEVDGTTCTIDAAEDCAGAVSGLACGNVL
jgi:hypothetical protein